MDEVEQEPEGNRFSRTMAYVLDDLIKIPGTNKRIGLDPLIGLIPGVGDTVTSVAGLALLATGAQRKIPNSVYLRMASNWSLNALVGAIPFAGDAFSFWFKSNRRNYELMAAHAGPEENKRFDRASWIPLVILVTAVVLVMGVIGTVLYALLQITG